MGRAKGTPKLCSIEGCEKVATARGWCVMHYHRWRRHGTTDRMSSHGGGYRRGDISTWFMKNVEITRAGCWLWKKYRDRNGYGRVQVDHKNKWVHRFSYEHFVGPIPEGLQIDHLCRTPLCINPEHLEAVTPLENTRRGRGHGKETHCPRGHPYDEVNTYVTPVGRRQCRVCRREWIARWRQAKKLVA